MRLRALIFAALLPSAGFAQDDAAVEDFVAANLISVFYHELGHALIDVMGLPVFGQEEDAADTASILFIDASFDEETATGIATDAALGFAAEAELNEVLWWSEHGADLQRFYNLVCLFYGADPDERDDFAEDMGLPEERAETCAEEFDLANESWGPVLEDLLDGDGQAGLTYRGAASGLIHEVIRTEVATLNAEIRLPEEVGVTVEPCGEANGFYDPESVTITICTEIETHLRKLAAANP